MELLNSFQKIILNQQSATPQKVPLFCLVKQNNSDGVSRLGLGLKTRLQSIFASLGLEGFRSRDLESVM